MSMYHKIYRLVTIFACLGLLNWHLKPITLLQKLYATEDQAFNMATFSPEKPSAMTSEMLSLVVMTGGVFVIKQIKKACIGWPKDVMLAGVGAGIYLYSEFDSLDSYNDLDTSSITYNKSNVSSAQRESLVAQKKHFEEVSKIIKSKKQKIEWAAMAWGGAAAFGLYAATKWKKASNACLEAIEAAKKQATAQGDEYSNKSQVAATSGNSTLASNYKTSANACYNVAKVQSEGLIDEFKSTNTTQGKIGASAEKVKLVDMKASEVIATIGQMGPSSGCVPSVTSILQRPCSNWYDQITKYHTKCKPPKLYIEPDQIPERPQKTSIYLNYDRLLQHMSQMLLEKAQAMNIKALMGLGSVGFAVMSKVQHEFGKTLDKWIAAPGNRAIVWGALGAMAYISSKQLDKMASKMDENVGHIDSILSSPSMVALASDSFGGEQNGEAGESQTHSPGYDKEAMECFSKKQGKCVSAKDACTKDKSAAACSVAVVNMNKDCLYKAKNKQLKDQCQKHKQKLEQCLQTAKKPTDSKACFSEHEKVLAFRRTTALQHSARSIPEDSLKKDDVSSDRKGITVLSPTAKSIRIKNRGILNCTAMINSKCATASTTMAHITSGSTPMGTEFVGSMKSLKDSLDTDIAAKGLVIDTSQHGQSAKSVQGATKRWQLKLNKQLSRANEKKFELDTEALKFTEQIGHKIDKVLQESGTDAKSLLEEMGRGYYFNESDTSLDPISDIIPLSSSKKTAKDPNKVIPLRFNNKNVRRNFTGGFRSGSNYDHSDDDEEEEADEDDDGNDVSANKGKKYKYKDVWVHPDNGVNIFKTISRRYIQSALPVLSTGRRKVKKTD